MKPLKNFLNKTMKGRYLYCIIKEPRSKKFKTKGIKGGQVYTFNGAKFSAVVSNVEPGELLPTRENLLCHQKVVEEVLKDYSVLPISFGAVVQIEEEIKKLFKSQVKELAGVFKKIEGKIELNLKVFWQDMPAIFQEIVKENKVIQTAKARGAVGRNAMLAVGEMVAKDLKAKKDKESSLILKPLLKIAQDFKKGEVLRDDMILNADFLVEREREKKFDKAVKGLDKIYSQRLKFKYIGPIPPFNFVDIHFKV